MKKRSDCDSKEFQQCPEDILTVKAGINQVFFFLVPPGKPTIINHFFAIFDDERNNVVSQTFFEGNKPAYTAVTILKGMNLLKLGITALTIRKYLTYLEDAFLLNKAQRYNVKGRKYIGSMEKYYFCDLGIRNSILGYRQFEPTHLMENLIYNELIHRGFSVDVGAVQKNLRAANGNGAKEYYEVDFVANKASDRFYIQSAYSLPDEEKIRQEEQSLDNIKDNFEKVIITLDDFVSFHRNQKGYIVMNLLEFLLNKDSLV